MTENENLQTLKPRQLLAIEALLTEPSVKSAAKTAKVSQATLHRWLKELRFQSAYDQARRAVYRRALERLSAAADETVDVLRSIMHDETAKPGERVSAVRVVLDFAHRGVETIDLEDRIALLEAHARQGRKLQ